MAAFDPAREPHRPPPIAVFLRCRRPPAIAFVSETGSADDHLVTARAGTQPPDFDQNQAVAAFQIGQRTAAVERGVAESRWSLRAEAYGRGQPTVAGDNAARAG